MKRAVGIIVASLAAVRASADAVTDWNEVLLDAIRADRTAPPPASRAMAMVHVAMYDAINGIVGGYEPYMALPAAPPDASPDVAAAVAAHGVLSALYPDQRAMFDAALQDTLPRGTLATGPVVGGVIFGTRCAKTMLALRANDGWDEVVDYVPGSGPGYWIPTPPGFLPAAFPQWPFVTPFCMASGDQFRVVAPPALDSADYAASLNEVRLLGRRDSLGRTPEQTEIALFWADGPGTATPPGHWLVIAQDVAEPFDLTPIEHARLFALVSLAACEAAIVSWDNKYAYEHWRPITAIHQADTDGNPDTDADPTWEPLITTPPFPTYTSGHSTFSGAASRVLALYFGTDDIAFTTTTDGMPGVERSFTSFSQAAEEAGRSRIYGGIHFEYDNAHGLASGRALAEDIFGHFLRPLP